MFNNIPNNDKLTPTTGEHNLERGMQLCEQNQYLKVGKKHIDNSKLLFPIHTDFEKYETHEELYQAIKNWWINTKNRAESTIKTRIKAMRYCQRHPIYPVDWFHFDQEPEQILNLLLYLSNVEYKQKATQTGNYNYGINHIHNLWKTVKTVAEAKGVDINWWGWTPPSKPENKVKTIPRPIIVNQLIHHRYSYDPVTNSLIKTILTLGFNSGLRPEEIIILQTKNVDFDTCSLILIEQKKRYRNRQIRLDPAVMYNPNQSSMYNWINIWRPRIKTKDNNYLFIQTNGKPFPNEDCLRTFLAKRVKQLWKPFSPKKMRDWNAIARLIRTKEKTGKWDIRTVTKALGHKQQSTTEGYVEFAELYYQNDTYDWLRSVLRHQKCMMQENRSSHKEKTIKPEKLLELTKNPPVGIYGPRGVTKQLLLLITSVKNRNPTFHIKTFLFSFYKNTQGVAS